MTAQDTQNGSALSLGDFNEMREDIAQSHRDMQAMLNTSEHESRKHAVRAFNRLSAVVALLLDHVDYTAV